jgi:hypothetical protein
MPCLFHGDYGPQDPNLAIRGSTAVHGGIVDPIVLREARNIGEAEAIQRHVLRGEAVSWCHQGYSWVDQSAIGWFYIAVFVFIVLPYFLMKIDVMRGRFGGSRGMNPTVRRSSWMWP